MKASVRLKGLWATALVASLAVLPSMAFGQNEFAPVMSAQNQPAAVTTTGAGMQTNSADQSAEARRLMLKARRALANGDLPTASSLATAAKKLTVDFQQLGDSPATIEQLVARRTQLAEMAQASDPQFNTAAASYFLIQAEALIHYGDFDNATSMIAKARTFPVEFNDQTGSPDKLEQMLNARRAAAGPVDTPASNALKLMSRAQLAFDRGQYNDALAMIADAKALNVPTETFTNGVKQPWQLELEVQQVMSRTKFDPNVTPTQLVDGDGNGGVKTADYNPNSDTTRNVAVSMTDDGNQFGNPQAAKIPTTATELYQAGIESLRAGNRTEAKNYLQRAWDNREALDALTRQSIQDQMLRLSASNPNPVQQASQNQPLEKSLQEQDVAAFRQLQKEVFRDRAEAERLLEKSPREALQKMSMIRNRIGQSSLDAQQQRPLLTMMDRDMAEVQTYIEQNLSTIENAEINQSRKEFIELRRQRRLDVETQLQKLVETYNDLVNEERFAEATVIAKQAYELAPENETAVLLKEKAVMMQRNYMNEQMKERKSDFFWNNIYNAQSMTAIDLDTDKSPMIFGDREEFYKRGQERTAQMNSRRFSSEAEAKIWNALENQQVQGEYRGPLSEVVDQLSRQSGVNIIFDQLALSNDNVLTDTPVNVPITTPISLESALQIIVEQKGLVFVVENEVIKVTTKDARSSNLSYKTYYIGDLVMPMTPPQNPYQMEFMQPRMVGSMGGSMNVPSVQTNASRSQLSMAQQLGNMQQGNPFGGLNYGGYGDNRGPQMGQPTYATVGQKPLGGVTEADFTPLIDLIRGTIATESWDDAQGLGTIRPYVQNLSLVVSNTQEVQDQIQDLLSKLRELNDVQIVVEVRFVTLQDDFFERVGIDFDFAVNDSNNVSIAADRNSQSGIIGTQNIDANPRIPTSDGDIEFLQGNFGAAEPLFGGFNGGASAATLGFAILSDIEVFFLLSAAKGNVRTNITQAPTVTMFNGQSATINDTQQRPFVTSVVPVVGDFAVAHQPIITLLPDGTNLNVTAVVSADRKYVRLQLVPFFSQVTEVNTFTFDGSQTTEQTTNSVLDDLLDIVNAGQNADDTNEELQTSVQGITVQLPTLASTSVSTVVSVPDGGTVLMGGIKRMSEGRTESGVPFLSNLPYVNRLFKNVAIGHETNHLMMMVTPRIIIQREIEEDNVGLSN
ncbi:MAG: hypothetical protein AAFN77_01885 [Planctomycetota bacterium]